MNAYKNFNRIAYISMIYIRDRQEKIVHLPTSERVILNISPSSVMASVTVAEEVVENHNKFAFCNKYLG